MRARSAVDEGAARARMLSAAAVVLLLGACGPPDRGDGGTSPDEALAAVLGGGAVEWVDLTHPFDHRAVYWPTAEPFRLDTVAADSTEAGYWYAANAFSAAEHGGTHLDAPLPLRPGGGHGRGDRAGPARRAGGGGGRLPGGGRRFGLPGPGRRP